MPDHGTATMNVKLYPPAGAKEGDEGVLTLGVKVHDNASRFVTFTSIATTTYYRIMVPYIKR